MGKRNKKEGKRKVKNETNGDEMKESTIWMIIALIFIVILENVLLTYFIPSFFDWIGIHALLAFSIYSAMKFAMHLTAEHYNNKKTSDKSEKRKFSKRKLCVKMGKTKQNIPRRYESGIK